MVLGTNNTRTVLLLASDAGDFEPIEDAVDAAEIDAAESDTAAAETADSHAADSHASDSHASETDDELVRGGSSVADGTSTGHHIDHGRVEETDIQQGGLPKDTATHPADRTPGTTTPVAGTEQGGTRSVTATTDVDPDVYDPDTVDDETIAAADAIVITDVASLDRVRDSSPGTPLIALSADPTDPIATDPIVDAWTTDLATIDDQIRWLKGRWSQDASRDTPSIDPSRIERLQASASRLAGVRTRSKAFQTAVSVSADVLPADHVVVGIVDEGWVEPVAVYGGDPTEENTRVRVGTGIAGTVVATGESRIETAIDHDVYAASLTVPVGDDAVIQALSRTPAAFDEQDRELATVVASHLEETLGRIAIDEAHRTERDRMLALFENVPDAAVAYEFVDGELRAQRVNRAFEETFGYDAETVVGKSIDEIIVPTSAAAAAEAAALNDRLRNGENVRREVTRRTADGERHFIVHVIPIHLESENASGFAIYTDVTERREREALLERQHAQLDKFTAIVSHDLRNPLSVAGGYVELARETGDHSYLDNVTAALDRMEELVTDLLSLAREGQVVGDLEPTSIAAIAQAAWDHVETGEATLEVVDDQIVEVDPNRTRELFENLFRNSVEHGTSGDRSDQPDDSDQAADADQRATRAAATAGLTVRVGTLTRASDGAQGMYVEDNGAGFDDAEADRLFESGYTTDSNGTGLGLAIAAHIAEAHSWEVRAMAGDGGGARFEFRFEA